MPVPKNLTTPALPSAVRQAPEEQSVLVIAPNQKFFLVFYPDHPGNWFVGEIGEGEGVSAEEVGPWWLPKLQAEPVKPGLNLHRTRKKEERPEAAHNQAHMAIIQDGGIVLPESLGYCVPYNCVHPITNEGGTYYADPWSSPKPKIRGQAQKFSFDRNRYHRWLLQLMVDGIIPRPSEEILRHVKGKRQARIARREAQADLPDDKRDRLVAEAQAEAQRVEGASVPVGEDAPRKVLSRKKRTEGEG